MQLITLLPNYLVWHYTRALSDFYRVAGNILWFVFNFFSIEILLSTLISPWRRLSKDESGAHPTFFTNLVINVLMRLVGILVRTVTIILGLFSSAAAFLALISGFFIWLLLPFLIPAAFLYGVGFLI